MPPLTRIVKILLLANVAVFVIGYLLKLDLAQQLGLRIFTSSQFNSYQLLTHMFVHGSFMHLFSNMLSLFMFGPMLERALGEGKFLFFYLVCALGAAVLYSLVAYWELSQLQQAAELYLANPSADSFLRFVTDHAPQLKGQLLPFINDYSRVPQSIEYQDSATELVNSLVVSQTNQPMVGASGAIFGVLMGFGYLFPNVKLMLMFPPIPLKAKYFIGIYAAIELFSGIRPTVGDNVAHFAHIGGMVFALLLLKIWNVNRNTFS